MQVFRDYRLIECETTMRRLTPVAIREVAVFDTEDVAPVIHAHWELYHDETNITYGSYACTNCKTIQGLAKYRYCPYCGAKMDEEVDNA